MMLKPERNKPSGVSFEVDLNAAPSSLGGGASTSHHLSPNELEIKKRLETYSSTGSEDLTLQAIALKLKKAEEKRQKQLLNRGGAVSPRIVEERRRIARERKQAMDKEQLSHLKEKTERENQADEKRKQTWEERRMKLRKHIKKVEERCRVQAELRQTSAEKMKSDINKKLVTATQKRDENLENVKIVAHHSAEKKKHGASSAAGIAPSAYDELPVPTH